MDTGTGKMYMGGPAEKGNWQVHGELLDKLNEGGCERLCTNIKKFTTL